MTSNLGPEEEHVKETGRGQVAAKKTQRCVVKEAGGDRCLPRRQLRVTLFKKPVLNSACRFLVTSVSKAWVE